MYRPTAPAKGLFGDVARPPTAAVIGVLIGVVYLWWRSSTLGAGTLLLLSVPFLAVEVWSLVELGFLTVQTWRLPEPTPRAEFGREYEPVDIAIVAAGADIEELERTLLACRSVRSRGRLVVIDDHRRFRPRSLAADAGASYHIDRRAIEAPGLAAYRNTTSTHYLWLQAGQLPMPDLIEAIGPRLERADVAVCQVATSLLNSDDLAHLGRERDDDALVNDVIGPALSRWDAGLWLGSASVVRRRAIEDIGGFDRLVPIERLVARLHRAGWATTFERRQLVATTAPEAIDHYLAKRRQQAGAALSVVLSADGPLVPGGAMTPRQRLAHLGAAVRFGAGLRLIVLSLLVVAVLFSGRFPAETGLVPLVAFGGATALAGALGRRAIARGSMQRGDWIHQGWRVVGAEAAAVVDALTGRVEPVPTDPEPNLDATGLRALAHLPLLDAIVLLLDVALLARAVTIVNRNALPAFTTGQRIVVIGFAMVMLVPIVRVLQVTVARQQRRSHYRIPVSLEATVDGTPATAIDITPEGAGVVMPFEPTVGVVTSLEVSLPGADGVVRRIVGRAVIRSARPEDPEDRTGARRWRAGLELVQMAPAARRALVGFCAQQPIPDDGDEPELVVVVDPATAAQHRRRRSIRMATMGAGLAGLATVVFGPGVASASTADPALVERVCVVAADGGPVADVAVERLSDGSTQVLGVTDLVGCLDTGPGAGTTGFAVTHRGARYQLEPGDYQGAVAEVALVTWRVRVVDLDGQPAPGVEVRFFTNRWLRATDPVVPGDGHRFDGLPIDPEIQQVEVRRDGVRHVRAIGETTQTAVVLSRIRIIPGAPDDALPVIDRGRGWEPLTDGEILVPGPVVIRLGDGEILRIDVPESHELILPDGILVPVELDPEPLDEPETEPEPETETDPDVEGEPDTADPTGSDSSTTSTPTSTSVSTSTSTTTGSSVPATSDGASADQSPDTSADDGGPATDTSSTIGTEPTPTTVATATTQPRPTAGDPEGTTGADQPTSTGQATTSSGGETDP